MSYHNGSIWPHDNAIIAVGLRRYGFTGHVQRLFAAMFEAASYMDLRRLPELFCGFRRTYGRGPTFYPVACAPQAWASATPFALLQASLGVEFDPTRELVCFHRPCLPDFLDEITLKGLTLPGGRLDVVLRRYQNDVSVNVLRREGTANVSVSL
jgi:glycogen debranching enzyme